MLIRILRNMTRRIFSLQKKKMYTTQKKEVKQQKEEAELYKDLLEDMDSLKTRHTLWNIFSIHNEMKFLQVLLIMAQLFPMYLLF